MFDKSTLSNSNFHLMAEATTLLTNVLRINRSRPVQKNANNANFGSFEKPRL